MVPIVAHVALGQTKVDDIDLILVTLVGSNQKVVWLDVSVQETVLVDLLDSADHLESDQAGGLQVELALGLLKQVLQARPKQIHYYYVELVLRVGFVGSNVVQLWHISYFNGHISSQNDEINQHGSVC